jgi:hypothetical protein
MQRMHPDIYESLYKESHRDADLAFEEELNMVRTISGPSDAA